MVIGSVPESASVVSAPVTSSPPALPVPPEKKEDDIIIIDARFFAGLFVIGACFGLAVGYFYFSRSVEEQDENDEEP